MRRAVKGEEKLDRDVGLQDTAYAAAGAGTSVPALDSQPDVFQPTRAAASRPEMDDVDQARAQQYALLATLLQRPADAEMLARLSRLRGSATPLGLAHIALGEAAAATSAEAVRREFFDLFVGVGRGELVPYASFYLTGFLNDRPLVRLRADLNRLGLERAEGRPEPEDNVGTLCEIMSGLASGTIDAPRDEERHFFRQHVASWAGRFFADLEAAEAAGIYRVVGTIGRVFVDIEAEAFDMET
jgi:TorA maturation chaperone TorD